MKDQDTLILEQLYLEMSSSNKNILFFLRDTKNPEEDVIRNFSCVVGSWVGSKKEAIDIQQNEMGGGVLNRPKQDPFTKLWCYDPEVGLSGYAIIDEDKYENDISLFFSIHGLTEEDELALFSSGDYDLGSGSDGEDCFRNATYHTRVSVDLSFDEIKEIINKILLK